MKVVKAKGENGWAGVDDFEFFHDQTAADCPILPENAKPPPPPTTQPPPSKSSKVLLCYFFLKILILVNEKKLQDFFQFSVPFLSDFGIQYRSDSLICKYSFNFLFTRVHRVKETVF